MTSDCDTVTLWHSATLTKRSSSSIQSAKKPMRNVWECEIVWRSEWYRQCQWSQRILVLSCTPSYFLASYTDIKCMAYSFTSFLHSLNKKHNLGTHSVKPMECLFLLSFLYVKWTCSAAGCDVITFHTHCLACMQVAHWQLVRPLIRSVIKVCYQNWCATRGKGT